MASAPGKKPQLATNSDDPKRIDQTYESLLGQKAEITLKNGAKYSGVFVSIDPLGSSTCLKSVKKEGVEKIIPLMNILGKDIISISIVEQKEQKSLVKTSATFKTDTAISRAPQPKNRVLQKWVPDEEFEPHLSLDKKDIGAWDQFETNEKKFGVKTDFNEDDYTTILDKSGEDFKQKEAKAQQLAWEIERTTSNNPHIAEERGQKPLNESQDEEDRFSSVIREEIKPKSAWKKSQSNRPAHLSTMAQSLLKRSIADTAKTTADQSKKAPRADSAVQTANNNSPQIVEEVHGAFKIFGKTLRNHISTKKKEILREGRKEVIADLKKFSADFQIPPSIHKNNIVVEAGTADTSAVEDNKMNDGEKEKSEKIQISNKAQMDSVSVNATKAKVSEDKITIDRQQSVTSEADSQTTTTSKPKSTFKLSAKAAEFTPSFTPMFQPQMGFQPRPKTNKGYKGHGNGPRPPFPQGYSDPYGNYPPGDANFPMYIQPYYPPTGGYPIQMAPGPGFPPPYPQGFGYPPIPHGGNVPMMPYHPHYVGQPPNWPENADQNPSDSEQASNKKEKN